MSAQAGNSIRSSRSPAHSGTRRDSSAAHLSSHPQAHNGSMNTNADRSSVTARSHLPSQPTASLVAARPPSSRSRNIPFHSAVSARPVLPPAVLPRRQPQQKPQRGASHPQARTSAVAPALDRRALQAAVQKPQSTSYTNGARSSSNPSAQPPSQQPQYQRAPLPRQQQQQQPHSVHTTIDSSYPASVLPSSAPPSHALPRERGVYPAPHSAARPSPRPSHAGSVARSPLSHDYSRNSTNGQRRVTPQQQQQSSGFRRPSGRDGSHPSYSSATHSHSSNPYDSGNGAMRVSSPPRVQPRSGGGGVYLEALESIPTRRTPPPPLPSQQQQQQDGYPQQQQQRPRHYTAGPQRPPAPPSAPQRTRSREGSHNRSTGTDDLEAYARASPPRRASYPHYPQHNNKKDSYYDYPEETPADSRAVALYRQPPPPPPPPPAAPPQQQRQPQPSSSPSSRPVAYYATAASHRLGPHRHVQHIIAGEVRREPPQPRRQLPPSHTPPTVEECGEEEEWVGEDAEEAYFAPAPAHHHHHKNQRAPPPPSQQWQAPQPYSPAHQPQLRPDDTMSVMSDASSTRGSRTRHVFRHQPFMLGAPPAGSPYGARPTYAVAIPRTQRPPATLYAASPPATQQQHQQRPSRSPPQQRYEQPHYNDYDDNLYDDEDVSVDDGAMAAPTVEEPSHSVGRAGRRVVEYEPDRRRQQPHHHQQQQGAVRPAMPPPQPQQQQQRFAAPSMPMRQVVQYHVSVPPKQQQPEEEDDRYSEQAPSNMDYHAGPPHDRTVAAAVAPQHRQQQQQPRQKLRRHPQQQGPGRPTKDRHGPLAPPPLPARQHVYTEEAPEGERGWDDEGDETASGHHYANRTPSGSSQRAPPPTLPPSRPLQSSDSFRPHTLTRDAARQPRRPQAGPQAGSRAPAVAPSSRRPVTEDELEPPSSATLAAPLRLGYERRDEGREEEEESEGATGHQRQHRPPQPSGRPAQRHDDDDGGARPRRPSSGAPVGTTQLVVMSPPPQPPQSPSYSEEEEEEEEEESEDAAGDLEAATAPQPQQQQHQQPVAPTTASSPSVTSRRLSVAQDADGSRAFDMDSSIDPEDLLAQQEAKKLAAELVRRSLLPPTPYVAAQAMGGGAPYSDGDGENSKDCVKGEEMPDESGEGHPGDQQTEEEPFRLDGPSAAAGGPTAAERQAEEAPQEPAAEAHKAEQDTATQRVPTPQPPEVLHATDDAPAAPDDAVAPSLPQEEEEEAEGSQSREPADAYDSLRNERRVSHDDATQEDVDVNASLSKEERSDHGNGDEDEEDGVKEYLTAVEQQQEGEGEEEEELGRARDISAAEDPHPRQHADEKVVETPDVPHSAPEQLATPPPAAHAHQHKEADTTDPHPHDVVYAAGWDSDSADASPLDVGERYGYVDPLEEAAMDAAYMLDTLEDQYVRINEETGEEMEDLVHVVELNRHDRTVEPRCFVPKGQYSDVLPLLRYPTGAAAAAAQDAEADSAATVPAAPPAHDALEYVPLSEAAYLNLCAIIWMTRFHGEDVPRLLSIAQGSAAHQEVEEEDGAAMEGSGCYFDHPSADVVEQLDSLIIQHVRYVVEESCAQSGESFATACARLADRSNLAYLPTYVWQQSATASSLSVPSVADHVTEVLLAATVPHEARRRQAARRQLTNDAEVRAQKTWPLFLGALPWNYEEVVEAEMYATMPTAAARLAYAFMYKARMRNLSGGLGALTFSALSAQIPDAAVLDSLLMQEKLRLALLFSYRNVAACCALRQKAVKNRCVSTSLLNSQGGDREEDEGRDDSSSSNSKNNGGGGGSRRRSEGETEAGQKGWTSPVFSAYLQLWEGDKAANVDPAAGAGTRTTTDTSTDDQLAQQQQQQQAEEELTLNDDEDIVDLYSIAVQLNCFFPTKTERGMHQLCAALIEDLIATDVLMVPEEVRTPEGAVLTDRTAIVDALVVEGAQAMRHIIMTLSERGYTSAVSTEDYVSPSGQVDMAAVREDMQGYLVLFDPAVMYFLSSPVPVDELFQYLRSDGPPSMQPHSLGRKSAFVEVLRLQHIAETIQYAMEMQDAILVSSQYNHLVAVHRRRLQQRNPHVRPTPRSIAEELQMDAVVVGHSMDLLLNAAPLLPRDHDTSLLAELANSSPAHNGGGGSGDGVNRHDESLDQMRLGASNGNSMEALDNYNYNDDGEEADLSGEAVRLRAVLVALCSADPMKPVEEVQQYLRHLLVLYYEARDEHNNLVEAADPLQVAHARARAAELALVDWFGATEQNGTLTPGAAPARCDSTRVNAEELAALCPRVLGRRVGLASSAVADAAAVISASEQALAREAQADAEGLEDSVRLAETASRPPLAP